MPSTLGHLGVQSLLTRSAFRKSDLIWIYIGVLIPDLPWITQRIIKAFFPGADLYDIRLYCVIQSSLIFSLLAAVAFVLLSSDFKKALTLLSINVILHLILDSLETKWGNGVQPFVPFDWSLINFGLFWPESIIIYTITVIGLFYIIFKWKDAAGASGLFKFKTIKVLGSAAVLIAYLLIPLLFMGEAENADNHYVKTLRNVNSHQGKYFEVDRGTYLSINEKEKKFVTPFKGEYNVKGINLTESGTMSIRARFASKDEIQIIDYHFHSAPLRDIPSYIGFLFILLLIFINIRKSSKKSHPDLKESGKEVSDLVNY